MGPALVLAALLLVAPIACGGDDGGGPPFDVTSEVVSGEMVEGMHVFEPKADGAWPVVFLLHGIDGSAADMRAFGTHLATEGNVVFAPTYRSDISTQQGIQNTALDGECAYRLARSIAADHGGDLDKPVTLVGWSLGASLGLALGMTEQIDPTGEFVTCSTDVPRPDVVVAISGCHYENDGRPNGFLDTTDWGNKGADLLLIGGEEDERCAAWQSTKAANELRSDGYDVDLVTLAGADHFAPVFQQLAGDTMVDARDETAGNTTVAAIVEAIAARAKGS